MYEVNRARSQISSSTVTWEKAGREIYDAEVRATEAPVVLEDYAEKNLANTKVNKSDDEHEDVKASEA